MAFNTNSTGGGGSNIFGQNKVLGESSMNNTPLFGQTSTSVGATTQPTTTTSQNLFGGTPSSKPETSVSTQSLFSNPAKPATGGLFSIPTTSSSFSFGGSSVLAPSTENKSASSLASPFESFQTKGPTILGTSSELSGASTPAKPFSFNTSTTPAGPPPKNNISDAKGPSLFGTGGTSSKSKLFGGNGSDSKSLFADGPSKLFGASKPTTESIASTAPEVPKLPSAISNSMNTSAPDTQSTGASNTLKVPSSSAQTSSSLTSKPDLFSAPSNTHIPSSAASIAATAAPSSSMSFSFLSTLGTKRGAPATTTPVSTAPDTTSTQPSDVKLQEKTTSATTGQSGSAPPLGSSTVGPTPQLTRLKNKTIDEIITRWASDLSKYQKEFQEQANKVARWDKLMVENGEKIQKLYLSTFEADRQNAEIERQLLNVENQQDEVASWLDKYESEIDEMFSRQVGQTDVVQGPDQEREKTYKLAEKLSDRLDEMGKNLTSMIDAINDASTILSKTGKADDPLSSIVWVLNNHLTTLQWIDENAEALKLKIEEAQRAGKCMASNGLKGSESESADYFYRSLMGRK